MGKEGETQTLGSTAVSSKALLDSPSLTVSVGGEGWEAGHPHRVRAVPTSSAVVVIWLLLIILSGDKRFAK